MTVCIAAIYNDNSILGVSDRMLTSGDIKFEPPASKIANITSSIAVMSAGDTSLITQLLDEANSFVTDRLAKEPKKWIPVVDVANHYRDTYIRLRADMAEKTILAPYKLDHKTFLASQKEMAQELVDSISYNLQNFQIEDVEIIVTGVDDNGAHIFVIENDRVSWNDKVGFASVGIGYNHALSHFMLAGHTRTATEAKTLLTIHQAKKKAEVSPGVGEETDMFLMGPGLGTFQRLEPLPDINIVKDLDSFYKKHKKEIAKLDKADEAEIQDYLNKLASRNSTSQKSEPPATKKKAENGDK